jgi:formylglycine-generating enzyme required for sulfatase activity
MAGSVWEWVAEHHPEMSAVDPKGPESGQVRVLRGGSWLSNGPYLRTAYRHKIDPDWRNSHNGFRCAQRAPQ